MKPDALDEKIIAVLEKNGRLSYRQIAKKVKVAVVTVMNRVKKLEDAGVITGYSVCLDHEVLGEDIKVMIMLRISKGKLFEVEKKISSSAYVFGVYDVTGDFDCLVLARFSSRRGLDSFLKRIQEYEFVERTQTSLILNTMKE